MTPADSTDASMTQEGVEGSKQITTNTTSTTTTTTKQTATSTDPTGAPTVTVINGLIKDDSQGIIQFVIPYGHNPRQPNIMAVTTIDTNRGKWFFHSHCRGTSSDHQDVAGGVGTTKPTSTSANDVDDNIERQMKEIMVPENLVMELDRVDL